MIDEKEAKKNRIKTEIYVLMYVATIKRNVKWKRKLDQLPFLFGPPSPNPQPNAW